MTDAKIKCVVVGDGCVGKTSLLMRYVRNKFPTGYIPTIFDNYTVTIPVRDDCYQLHLFDTAGQEEYDQVRRLAFIDADIFLICFSVDLKSSFKNVKDRWLPELKRLCPDVPYLIIGTKIDLRSKQNVGELIPKSQGEELAKQLSVVKYMECSALTMENVMEVFQEAVNTAVSSIDLRNRNNIVNNKSKCCFLM